MTGPEVLTVAQAAERIGIPAERLYRMVCGGRFAHALDALPFVLDPADFDPDKPPLYPDPEDD